MDTFVPGSRLHLTCLGVCLAATVLTAWAARRTRNSPRAGTIRLIIAMGCLLSWIASNGYGFFPDRFEWAQSLPLHFCNLANLLGAHALLTRSRTSQALMYFWTFALCVWAFLTPSLYVGPANLWFWLFWLYHLFIPIATAWILVADRFLPRWSDWRKGLLLTLGFMGLLAVVNAFTGWNYGFVGPAAPSQKTPIDLLGPYPLRLLSMAAIGSGLFALLTLVAQGRRRRKGDGHDQDSATRVNS